MAGSLYIHIPHCLQICRYCDFVKFEVDTILTPSEYLKLVEQEIRQRAPFTPFKKLKTIYWGGGTPSLASPASLESVLTTLRQNRFEWDDQTEMTLEVNPGTLRPEGVAQLLKIGINRFSVGMQTFDEDSLKVLGRKHTAQQSIRDFEMLKKTGAKLSADLMFALPHQTLKSLELDLLKMIDLGPDHISSYYLTLPERHPLQKNRPSDEMQADMMFFVEETLAKAGYHRYEISNFARPGFESLHNSSYWDSTSYWGLGISSHSYFSPQHSRTLNGVRFSNSNSLKSYQTSIDIRPQTQIFDCLPSAQVEPLTENEALTDFFHTRLRRSLGFSWSDFQNFFARPELLVECQTRVERLRARGLVDADPDQIRLSRDSGRKLVDQALLELTFI